MVDIVDNKRPDFDRELIAIADYVHDYKIDSELAYQTAYYDLLDSLACAFTALKFPECTKLLGPIVPEEQLKKGVYVPGTHFILNPIQAAFNLGTMIRWLDFNDTWLAAEWGHPSDNIGGILSVMDYISRNKLQPPLKVHDLLTYMIKAHEIQGILALENSFNRVGLDHVLLVKVATTAITTALLGGNKEQVCRALSQAWIDGQSLRTYRHAPNTGPRKSWAAGDATSRGVRLAFITMSGEIGYPSALSAKQWGFYDVYFRGRPFHISRPYGSYVMENILFKIKFPAEFHAQTAVECAFALHPSVKDRLNEISRIRIKTQDAAMRIINKNGPLHNPADRDHCLQYMIAVGLIFGQLTPEHYEDAVAQDPRIDMLRSKMQVSESPEFSAGYLDTNRRSIGNALRVYFQDGNSTEEVSIEYPIGHRRRREEGMPLLIKKFTDSVQSHFSPSQAEKILHLTEKKEKFLNTSIKDFVDLLHCPLIVPRKKK